MSFKRILACIAAALCLTLCAAAEECEHSWAGYSPAGAGGHERVCIYCGGIVTEPHTLTISREEANCVSPAVVREACGLCGYQTEYTEGEKSDSHSWGENVTIKEATCSEKGQLRRVCSLCGAEETVETDSPAHSFGSFQYYNDDMHARTCSVCGYTEKQRHDQTVSRTITLSRADRLGKKNFTCTACGYVFRRYFNDRGTLFAGEGVELNGNGIKYLKAETLNVNAGSSVTVGIYPDMPVTLTAVTNCSIEVYADVDTLEYQGIRLVSGSAELQPKNSATSMEFLNISENAFVDSLSIPDGNGSLLITREGNGAFALTQHRVDDFTATEVFSMKNGGGSMEVCREPSVSATGGGNIFAMSVKQSEAAASWTYNSVTSSLAVKASYADGSYSDIICAVLCGDDVVLRAEGLKQYNGILTDDCRENGWRVCVEYPSLGITVSTPVLDENGQIMIAASEAEPVPVEELGHAEPSGVALPVVTTLGPGAAVSMEVHTAPDISISSQNGTYCVFVSKIPAKWSLKTITFTQRFERGGMKLLNSYTENAVFPIENANSRVAATVVLISSSGETVRYEAGSFTYLAE